MSTSHPFRRGANLKTALAVVAALCALLALTSARASAAQGTQTWTGQSGGATPDIERTGLTLFDGSGAPITTNGTAGTINFTVNGTPYVGYCNDTDRIFSTGTELANLVPEDPPASVATRAATWIIVNHAPTGAPTPVKQTEAATAQVAIWLLLDAQINKTTPTNDAGLNAAAAALVAQARSATATPASVSLDVAAPADGATSSSLVVHGRPGAVVDLAVTSGTATLSATRVTIGPGGTATATLTASGPGSVGVSATTAGDGRFLAINPLDPVRRPQSTATAAASVLSASATVRFSAAAVSPGAVSPGTTGIPAAAQRARLTIAKLGPASARVLRRITYTIVVRNRGKAAATGVVITDPIPAGMSLVSTDRLRTLANGVLQFRIGRLAAGARVTVKVVLMADASVRGSRTNTATVSAAGLGPRRASVQTLFRAGKPRKVSPAVTG